MIKKRYEVGDLMLFVPRRGSALAPVAIGIVVHENDGYGAVFWSDTGVVQEEHWLASYLRTG